jgi:hypothetical protein
MPNTKIPKVHLEDEEIDSDEHSEMFTDGGMSAVRSFAEACQTEAIVIAAIETEEKAIDIFNDERDAASTDEARSDHGSVLENLYKEAARLTITPDRCSVSRVTVDAKERLVRLTNWTCPITKESTQINLPRVIEAAHVVRRSLKGEQV